ncbi:rust resistance kinase Lr10-like [Abrus precatorius]|uniref:non-specific serine/threonine protein kinase n=1 Tax=Abrus precatorius TaxID=3816 RepID=A0A8B8M9Z3_ABRPR|nr:rust resistance kinase Lr10-like [Abrus precatorius]
MPALSMFKSVIIFASILLLVSAEDGKCPPSFDCGFLGLIKFPFTSTLRPHCGVLPIRGCEEHNAYAPKTIQLINSSTSTSYPVLQVEPRTIKIRDYYQHNNIRNRSCKAFSNNITLPHTSPLASFYIKYNITIFRCNHSLNIPVPKNFYKYSTCSEYNIYYGPANTEMPRGYKWPSSLAPCSTVQHAVIDKCSDDPFQCMSGHTAIEVQLSEDCEECLGQRRGQCQLDSEGKFYCAKGSRSWVVKMVLGLVGLLAVTAALLLVMIKIFYTRRKKKNPTNQRIEIFLERYGPLQTKRYGYSEIKKVTNSFRNKLGQGGFGSVYKGQLQDGRYVAVKVLNELKDDGEDFINEVATISRTSHINIVSLLGFCFEGSKRALVYEFMSNGSLEKFIFEGSVLMTDCQLDCQMLYHIAIGVARGLEYLHKGCNTRILHFDIKPHNILLDENFNPKISDFGLAKICTRKESAISIFGARGTAGYIAPEVFSRNFGTVSHKSDVYSYGMMILDMVGTRKNVKAQVDHSSEIYFPHWIYKHLESNQELGLRIIRNENDSEKVRKMTMVGLWCIQTDPSTRPNITKVVEMLEGTVELLPMPPKPFLSSPSAFPVDSSSESSIVACHS